MKNFIPFLIAWSLISCAKSETNDVAITGIYVEESLRNDTIESWELGDSPNQYFVLRRGYENRNGYFLPKIYSDFYLYSITGDSIAIHPGSSSCWNCMPKLFFTWSSGKDTFIIGDFIYHRDNPNLATLKFVKQK